MSKKNSHLPPYIQAQQTKRDKEYERDYKKAIKGTTIKYTNYMAQNLNYLTDPIMNQPIKTELVEMVYKLSYKNYKKLQATGDLIKHLYANGIDAQLKYETRNDLSRDEIIFYQTKKVVVRPGEEQVSSTVPINPEVRRLMQSILRPYDTSIDGLREIKKEDLILFIQRYIHSFNISDLSMFRNFIEIQKPRFTALEFDKLIDMIYRAYENYISGKPFYNTTVVETARPTPQLPPSEPLRIFTDEAFALLEDSK